MMPKRLFKDQMGREVLINYPPKRIISLVPSQTELLFDMGLDKEVVGITKFCVHPLHKFKTVTKIGGTKQFRMEVIRELQPDLIIGNKEENEQYQIEQLMQEYPVWMSDIYTLNDAYSMMTAIGEITDRAPEAAYLVQLINSGMTDVNMLAQQSTKRIKAAYLIWKDPYMVAGSDTFIDHILEHIGITNVITTQRYPEITEAELQVMTPDVIFLSSEPYPFKEKHIEALKLICPDARICLVDGEIFSWYGSRLRHAPGYLLDLLSKLGMID